MEHALAIVLPGTTLGLRSVSHRNFYSGVKIRGKGDIGQIECLRHSKGAPPNGVPLSVRGNDAARMSCLDGSFRCDVCNFSFFPNGSYFRAVFHVVNRTIAQMIDREETCGNVAPCTLIHRSRMRRELGEIKRMIDRRFATAI